MSFETVEMNDWLLNYEWLLQFLGWTLNVWMNELYKAEA